MAPSCIVSKPHSVRDMRVCVTNDVGMAGDIIHHQQTTRLPYVQV